MYMNVEYASWLKATYGLRESIRELVPSRNVPPLFALEPSAPAARTMIVPTVAAPRIRPANNCFLISPSSSSSRPERRLVHGERPSTGVERTTDAERKCGEVLSMAQGKLVENGDPERFQ